MTAKGKKARGGSRRDAASNRARAKQNAPTPPSVVAEAASAVDLSEVRRRAAAQKTQGNFEDAVNVLAEATQRDPENAELVESLAQSLLDAGRPEEAMASFKRAVELQPSKGFEKYMDLAQLMGNSLDAVDVWRKGIHVLREEKSCTSDATRVNELIEYEVSALCSTAESLLGYIEESGDQAVADRMDSEVETAICEAIAVAREGSPSELEASVALANLRLSQGRVDEARVAMERVVYRLRPELQAVEAWSNDTTTEDDTKLIDALEKLPPMDVRIAIGKQLVEVEQWPDAVAVLSSVLHECDFNIEVWYMLAISFVQTGDPQSAQAALDSARHVLANPDGYVGQLEEGMLDQLEALVTEGAAAD